MKKIIMFMLIGLGVIALISAAALTTTSVTYDFREVEKPLPTGNTISFSCDGETISVNGIEPNNDWDENDLQSLIKQNCTGIVTNIRKDGITYKENEFGLRSFDEAVLKADVCSRNVNELTVYDSKTGACRKPIITEGIGSEPIIG